MNLLTNAYDKNALCYLFDFLTNSRIIKNFLFELNFQNSKSVKETRFFHYITLAFPQLTQKVSICNETLEQKTYSKNLLDFCIAFLKSLPSLMIRNFVYIS